jgi:hypothetical protein
MSRLIEKAEKAAEYLVDEVMNPKQKAPLGERADTLIKALEAEGARVSLVIQRAEINNATKPRRK